MNEEKKGKVKNWLRNPYNLLFLAILIFSFIIRFYYFWLTKNQPLWWDESEYVCGAKGYAGIIECPLQIIRMPGFPLIMSIFFRLNLTNEPLLRFLVLFIPSFLSIYLVYICVKEMYPDKRIALISMAIFGVLWEHLFYSNRFHTENLSLIFEFLALIVLFRVYMKKENLFFIKPKYSIPWIILFSAFSVFFRTGNLIFLPGLFLFVLLLNQSVILGKKNKIYLILGLFAIIIFSVVFFMYLPKIPLLHTYYHPENKIILVSLSVFNGFYESYVSWIPSVLYYAFIFGAFVSIFRVLIAIDTVKGIKRDSERLILKSDIFNILMIIFVLLFFIFIMRPPTIEYRVFFAFVPGMLAFTSKGIIIFSEFAGNLLKNKKIAIILIILISALGVYTQIIHADQIIRLKVDSYLQVKEAGLWLKENSDKNDIIISASIYQNSYYSERKTINFYEMGGDDRNESVFWKNITVIKPKYLVVSVFEPGFTPQWAYDWPQRNNETVKPVQVYFLDPEQKQVALVIYEFIN